MFWNTLSHLDQLEDIVHLSFEGPVAIFKHSTSCPISGMAKRRIEQAWPDNITLFYLDLLSFRNISNTISEKFSVIHESPQLIVLYSGEVVYHGSHLNINISEVESNIQKSTLSELK